MNILHRFRALSLASLLVFTLLGGNVIMALGAQAQAPTEAGVTLEGCRGDAGLFPATGPFVCPDDLYTTGNLGTGWNELDLVPHRITFTAPAGGTTDANTTVALAADYLDAGIKGYDFISKPRLNTALSTGTCAITTGPLIKTGPSLGGADTTIYRMVTVTQSVESVCVYDYFQRLSLKSVLYPGSSLQSYVANSDLTPAGVGLRKISIPVPELPQLATKTMTATQGLEYGWNVTKQVSPSAVDFANTCDRVATAPGIPVSVTVAWTRLAPVAGKITLTTNIVVENPAKRPITADITKDIIYLGTAPGTRVPIKTLGSADFGGPQEVAAKGSYTFTNVTRIAAADLPAGTDLTNLSFSDDATVTYSSQVVDEEEPLGSQDVSATAALTTSTGPGENESAVITDVERITGDGLSFSVDQVTSAATGSFGDYILGTESTGPVKWTSDPQTSSGSATFLKTIHADKATVLSDGILSDVARVKNGETLLASAQGAIDIDADALGTLTIKKSIPDVLQGAETQVFNFSITNQATGDVVQAALAFGAGDTRLTTELTDLPLGTYTVRELTAAGFIAKSSKTAVFADGRCGSTVGFQNELKPASARVVKITVPSGLEEDWTVRLTGPGTPSGGEVTTTNRAGIAKFQTKLGEGNYAITEKLTAGWSQTSASGDCSFSVSLPADAGRTFVCTLTNTFTAVAPTLVGQPSNPETGEEGPSILPLRDVRPARGENLPFTGSEPVTLLVLAGLLVSAGGLLLWSQRRRTS